jgi:glycosyltransferase involved in cell wall biosynthesis
VIVGEKDTRGWSTAISNLLEDVSRRDELREYGLERARNEFAWPVVARSHLEFFDSVLAARTMEALSSV